MKGKAEWDALVDAAFALDDDHPFLSQMADVDETRALSDWDESKHPRDEKGRFAGEDAVFDAIRGVPTGDARRIVARWVNEASTRDEGRERQQRGDRMLVSTGHHSAMFAEWDESKHPRDESGRFTDGPGLISREDTGHDVFESSDGTSKGRPLHYEPRTNFEVNEHALNTEAGAEREFFRAIRQQYPNGVVLYHETTTDALPDIMRDGLRSPFATVGRPSNFVTAAEKVIVRFRLSNDEAETLHPDMLYSPEDESKPNAFAKLLQTHGGVYGSDVSTYLDIPPKRLDIYVAKKSAKKFADWDEEKHPRDDHGRFTSVGGSGWTKEHAARLKELKVPPAWTNVKLNDDPSAALQVVGTDAKGRTQYVYSAEHSAAAAAEKFDRLKTFNKGLKTLRAKIEHDLDSPHTPDAVRENATVLYLIDKTGFRVGSDKETHAEKEAFGATTLEARHVRFPDHGGVTFSFVGKKGVQINKWVEDGRLERLMKDRVKGKDRDERVFTTSDREVRRYLSSRDGHFKVKDFRTWHGTARALDEIGKRPAPKSAAEFKKAQREVATAVARHLGNTPNVALKSYIDPAAWGKWQKRLMS